jgi:hypothetical protein
MSRPVELEVQGDMACSMATPTRRFFRLGSAFAVWLALCSGCGARLDVLHETGGARSGGGSGGALASGGGSLGGSAGTTSMAGGSAGTTGEMSDGGLTTTAGTSATAGVAGTGSSDAISVCGFEFPESVPALTLGQPCIDDDICVPQSCAGIGAPPDTNVAAFAACRNHKVQVVSMTLLDLEPAEVPSDRGDGVSWDDCESALESGLTGQACTWPSESCIRRTSDPCCLEGAECLAPFGRLHRIRICAPGCSDAAPDAPAPVVTDCASAQSADLCHATPACEGDFICYRDLFDPETVSDYTETSQLNGAMWCGGGLLVGGYGLTWGL